MNILLVDDHPMVLHSLSGLLKSQGYGVSTADGCQRAREELLGGQLFDLLLLDYHLPDGSALDLLCELRERLPRHVVVISGISDAEETLYILEKTLAKAFVPKNIDLDDLVAAVRPRRIRVVGDFKVRGGIHTVVTVEHEPDGRDQRPSVLPDDCQLCRARSQGQKRTGRCG